MPERSSQRIDRLKQHVDQLDQRVSALEAAKPERPEPKPEPEPEPERPPAEVPEQVEFTVAYRDGQTWQTTVPLERDRVATGADKRLMFATCEEHRAAVNGTRYRVGVGNVFRNQGTVYWHTLGIRIPGGGQYQIGQSNDDTSRHVLLPRQFMSRTLLHEDGPIEALGKMIDYPTADAGIYPEWVPELCAKGPAAELAKAEQIGPYTISLGKVEGDDSFDGSHGGWRIGPYWMGPKGWQRSCSEGWVWAEMVAQNTMERTRLCRFNRETHLPVLDSRAPYWRGRTDAHEVPGWEYRPGDGWCPYEEKLAHHDPFNGSHDQRVNGPFAMLAEHSPWWRWILVNVCAADVEQWLWGGGTPNHHPALRNLESVIATEPKGEGWGQGGRIFAHAIRCLRWAAPHADAKRVRRWQEDIPRLIEHVLMPNGIVHRFADDPAYHFPDSARSREVQLLWPELEQWQLERSDWKWAQKCAATMAAISPPAGSESTHPGLPMSVNQQWQYCPDAFTATAPHWSEALHTGKPSYFPWYDLILRQSNHLIDLSKPWGSPDEQMLDLIDPDWLRELQHHDEAR